VQAREAVAAAAQAQGLPFPAGRGD